MDADELVVRDGDRAAATGRLVRNELGDWFEPTLVVAGPGGVERRVRPEWKGAVRVAGADFGAVACPLRKRWHGGGLGHRDRPQLGTSLCMVPSRWTKNQFDGVRGYLHQRWQSWDLYQLGPAARRRWPGPYRRPPRPGSSPDRGLGSRAA